MDRQTQIAVLQELIDRPDSGVVLQSVGLPDGYAGQLAYDIEVTGRDGSRFTIQNVTPSNPHPVPADGYRAKAAPRGTEVWISWRGGDPKVCVPWMPKTTNCVGAA